MRILMAAKYVHTGHQPIGGVQSWGETVETELARRGHVVELWQPGFQAPQGRYDLGILANMNVTGNMRHLCDFTVNVSHGIIRDEEPRMADWTFYVSEGVMNQWDLPRGSILRQPIDLNFWCPITTPRPHRYCTRFSYRGSETLCPALAKHLRLNYMQIGDMSHEDARYHIHHSHIVCASGRAALEAMACGANVLIYDHRSAYQEPLMDWDMQRQMENSYSGRMGKSNPDLLDLIEGVGHVVGSGQRHWVEEHHDVSKIVDQLLEVMA